MDVFHDVGPYDGMQVGLHEIEYEVNILVVLSFEDVEEGDDVRVPVQFLEEDHLTRPEITYR